MRSCNNSPTESNNLLSHLKIEYTTRIKVFISRRSRTNPYCEWELFFPTHVILSRKSFYLYNLVDWITHPHRTDLVHPKMLGEAPSICSRRKHQNVTLLLKFYLDYQFFLGTICSLFRFKMWTICLHIWNTTLKKNKFEPSNTRSFMKQPGVSLGLNCYHFFIALKSTYFMNHTILF